jgi:hypothetical protein
LLILIILIILIILTAPFQVDDFEAFMRDKIRQSHDMFLSDDLVYAGYFAMRRKRLLTHSTNLFSRSRGGVSLRKISHRSMALHRTPSDGSPLAGNKPDAHWARYWDIIDSGNMPPIPTDGTAPTWPAIRG